MEQGIDKIIEAIEGALVIIPDIKEAKESDDKITMLEGGMLVIKHGGKAVRFLSSLKEISEEIIDLDPVESAEIFDLLSDQFGGSDEAKEAIKKLIIGAASISQGLQGLIDLKK